MRRLAEGLFRRESGRLVSMLTGILGLPRLQLAEDSVQEAMLRALQLWPDRGVPEHPQAWLLRTARNLAIDTIRREANFRDKQPAYIAHLAQCLPSPPGPTVDTPLMEGEIRDHRLRLMFACCHPALPTDQQAALALKTLCGLGQGEMAAAFLTTETAIAKRLTRARQRLRDAGVAFEIPAGPELRPRLDGVLGTLYLLFNEGYKVSAGTRLIRADLCAEAIRLARVLAGHPVAGTPRVHALLALMLLNTARLPARTDTAGALVPLDRQDRARWDRGLISQGMRHLELAAAGDEASDYHLQAAISACHCLAPSDAGTDWRRILTLYDHLLAIRPSPVFELNRTVAEARVHGPERAIQRLKVLRDHAGLGDYYLTHTLLGEFEWQRSHLGAAAAHFQRALQLAEVAPERDWIRGKLERCLPGETSPP